MIRVLTFGRYADTDFGGLERYVLELASALRGQVSFTNIVAARGGPPDLEVAGDTIYARPIAHLGGAPVCPSMPWYALSHNRRRPFDLVHLHFPADPMAHLSTVLLPRRVKRIVSWHSDIVRQKKLFSFYRPFLDRLVRSADAIIVATPAHISSSGQLSAVNNRNVFHVVPYGIDVSRFRNRPPLADELRHKYGGKFLVFALGRHVYYKGFEFLIRSLASVPDAELVLGGKGPLTRDLARIALEAGVATRVHFAGRIPEAKLPAYYHACDAFCLPSMEPAEAFGIVQIEAMATGKPVVCCELHNGVTWVNQDGITGLVVPPADPAALAAALNRLRTNVDLRQRLGEQGRGRAAKEFTLDAMARGTLSVYERVMSN